MKKYFFIFILFSLPSVSFAQFTDDFSDGDFTTNPTWIGHNGNFEIDSLNQLHLNDTIANTSYLTTESKAIINGIWEFGIKMGFSPSTSNYSKVYLISNNVNLTSSLNGIYVRIGGESGTIDDVSLYVQNGSTTSKIIDGIDGIAAIDPDLKIKVTRDSIGNWELFVDTSNQYILQGSAFENSITTSNYFGIYCKYTSTRSDLFWFDNFNVSGTYDTSTIPQVNINDIVINEFFADPTPSIGLPKHEYIELYNRTNKAISLTDWSITMGTSQKQFPSSIIEADSFVILIKDAVMDSFPSNISKIGFPSISLTNGGADIILKDNNGKVINAISYTEKWYNDDNKNEGGWSIEQVNPNLFCEGHSNWRASIANIGGTPGKQNSVLGQNVFSESLRIIKAYPLDSNTLSIYFNKQLDSLMLTDVLKFNSNNINPVMAKPVAPFFNSVNLTFAFNFEVTDDYMLYFSSLLKDCNSQSVSPNWFSFGVPQLANEKDIIINEVLFNPKEDGVDYLEIYNNSNTFIDLSELRIANFFEFGGILNTENSKIITEEPFIIKPSEYLILTTDSAKVKAQYETENPYAFIEMESLPSLSNDQGTICIVHQSLSQIIDAFAYDEQMHFSLLETEDGVSLERLDKQAETQKNNNWHSAASTVGFGTPTYQNSQVYQNQTSGEVTVNPKSFSPNNDGYKDVCAIHWNFSKTNLMATISIFDSGGIRVNQLMNNKMIGNKGFEIWEGTSENGAQLKTGMYIVFMQVFSEEGEVESYKKVVVLHN
jgi:hypothetical protein